MDGKGTLRDGGSTAAYSFFLDCRASRNADQRLRARFDRRGFNLERVTSMRCSNDPAIPTPAAGFDTMRGAANGTLTSGGRRRPGHRVEFKFVDDARGNASDRSAIRIESPLGRALFSASGRPGSPGGGTGSSCSSGGDCRAVCRRPGCRIRQPGCRGSCGRRSGSGYNRARKTRNAPPTGIALSNRSVPENRPAGTQVGRFTTADRDRGDTHTYRLVPGPGSNDNGSFLIEGSTLRTRAAFDFEAKSSYSTRVRVTDGRGGAFEETLRITIEDVDEGPPNAAPTDISLSNSSVAENEPAGTVGTLSTSDPDAGDTHTYTLVSGTGDTDNASFEIAGDKLETKASLDHETRPSLSIRVRTSDGKGGTFEKALTITVTNVNEAPTDISLSPSSVDENRPAGTEVGTLSTADPDAGDTHTYRLASGTG
ncbi:MAG TPA: cadherin repeat domain-containing protein, partial [Thermoleophilaceae bacterium]|nr:cadherin repeat domain-containing protein [Thermoleophilaceae bacterium]